MEAEAEAEETEEDLEVQSMLWPPVRFCNSSIPCCMILMHCKG